MVIRQPITKTWPKRLLSKSGRLSLQKQFVITYPDKYDDTIFYLLPFYHKLFLNLEHLIVVDADVRFKADPYKLFEQFQRFSDKNILGVANDLAPHYHQVLQNSG